MLWCVILVEFHHHRHISDTVSLSCLLTRFHIYSLSHEVRGRVCIVHFVPVPSTVPGTEKAEKIRTRRAAEGCR